MMSHHHQQHHTAAEAFRRLFCSVFCTCTPEKARPQWRIKLGNGNILTFIGDFMDFKCTIDDGPFTLSVDKFVDDGGNTTTDTDIPVWASSDPTVLTFAPDPANPQGQIGTLTKKMGASVMTAAFGDQTKLGTPGNYLLSSTLTVNSGLAVAGSVEASGPGVQPA